MKCSSKPARYSLRAAFTVQSGRREPLISKHGRPLCVSLHCHQMHPAHLPPLTEEVWPCVCAATICAHRFYLYSSYDVWQCVCTFPPYAFTSPSPSHISLGMYCNVCEWPYVCSVSSLTFQLGRVVMRMWGVTVCFHLSLTLHIFVSVARHLCLSFG